MSDLLIATDRTPFEWVELDMPKCSRTYGSSPCLAEIGVTGADKCFNTRASCQDPDNYDGSETLTYRFCKNQARIPDDYNYLPYLQSASAGSAKINPGGGNSASTALGVRGTFTASFSDHPHTDNGIDPYLTDRAYDPFETSTFWPKFRARNPYYLHVPVRYKSGYIDPDTLLPDPTTLITRTFFVTTMTGFSSGGSAMLQAKDLLTMVSNDKATAPAASQGVLSADITDSATSFTASPTGIGDSEYPASGDIRINNEVMSFTRTGDVFTITRAQETTEAKAHSEGDTIQLCLRYSGETPAYILEDLLTTYGGIDSGYLDTAQWATEITDYLPRAYSALITKPTGINKLVSEMSDQMYFIPWWDDKSGKLKIQAVRPADGETITALDDDGNILENSLTWSDAADELVNEVRVYYSLKDPTKKLDDESNYGALEVINDAESKALNGIDKIKTIYSRWISGANGAAAIDLGQKILARYRKIPRKASFSIDAKDGFYLSVADFISVKNRSQVDFTGQTQIPVNMQITSIGEPIQGTTYKVEAMEYSGETIGAKPDEYLVLFSTDEQNVNLRDKFDVLHGVTPQSGDKIRFVVRSGVTIGGQASDPRTYDTDFAWFSTYPSYNKYSTITLPYLQRRDLSSPATYLLNYGGTADNYYDQRTLSVSSEVRCDIREVPVATSVTVGSWPSGVELYLDIEAGAYIIGEGGSCSTHPLEYSQYALIPVYGGDGGHAIDASGYQITINNLGIIAGGGGAGAGLGLISTASDITTVVSGGGGAGYRNSEINPVVRIESGSEESSSFPASPSSGDNTNNGYGIDYAAAFGITGVTAYTGDGGGLASNGNHSRWQAGPSMITSSSYGLAGDAVVAGSSNITWVNKGTVLGAEN